MTAETFRIGDAYTVQMINAEMRFSRTSDDTLAGYSKPMRDTANELRRLADRLDGGKGRQKGFDL